MKSSLYFHEFWVKVDQYLIRHPEQRFGQAVFNVLVIYRPDLSEQIRGTDLDPFYLDSLPDNIHQWLYRHWMD